MTDHQAHKPARLWRRAAARLCDACVMAVVEAVMIVMAGLIAVIVTRPGSFDEDQFMILWVLLMVPASIPAYLFEVGATARWSQTFGKRLADIRVVPWDDETAAVAGDVRLAHWRFAARWAIPIVPGIVAAVAVAIVVLPGAQDGDDFGWLLIGAFAVPWALVYASSLWDKNRRGWHDKAAGTIVVDDRS